MSEEFHIHPGVSYSGRVQRSPERVLWPRTSLGNVHLTPEFPGQFPFRPIGAGELWARIDMNDIASWSWMCTSAILILDEVIRCGASSDESNMRDLVVELRSLRACLADIKDEGCSTLLVPVPHTESSRGIYRFSLWPPDAEMILARRLRNRTACAAATVTPSSAQLGTLLSHAAAACPQTLMKLSEDFQNKLEEITGKIAILSSQIDFEQCMTQIVTECELLGEIVRMGCDLQAALHISLPDRPTTMPLGPRPASRVRTKLWGDLALSSQGVSLGSKDGNALAQLDVLTNFRPHLNVLPLYEMADSGSTVAVVMPLPENGSLEQYLRTNPDVNPRDLLQQAAAALAHIHLHSGCALHVPTLKTVLVSGDGDALLFDFGRLEQLVDQIPLPVRNPAHTAVPQGIDMAYVAPERHQGAPCSPEADVFAFGMLCFHAYLGEGPRRWPGTGDPSAAITRGERRERAEIARPDFTDAMWELVERCWAEDPEKRPTMAEVERLLSEMDTPEERLAKEATTVTMTMRIFTPDDEALRGFNEAQRKSEYVRETLEEMERQGLKKFITDVMQQNGCPRLTELLQEARAEKEKYSQVRFF